MTRARAAPRRTHNTHHIKSRGEKRLPSDEPNNVGRSANRREPEVVVTAAAVPEILCAPLRCPYRPPVHLWCGGGGRRPLRSAASSSVHGGDANAGAQRNERGRQRNVGLSSVPALGRSFKLSVPPCLETPCKYNM